MTDTTQTDCAAISVRLLDDAYLAWFGEESECEQALREWFAARGGQRANAYLAYRAALDREEAAADVYAEQLTVVASRASTDSRRTSLFA